MYFFVTKALLRPLPLVLLVLGAAIANPWRQPGVGRRRLLLVAVPFIVLALVSIPAATYPLLGLLEWPYPPLARRPGDAGAIVVLAGGILEPDAVRRRPELAEDALGRCLHAAGLHHQGGHARWS